jgi:hypothetical protein
MWDFQNLADKKRLIIQNLQVDIDKLEQAIELIGDVNETLSEAFWNRNQDQLPSTGSSAGSAPMKLSRSISEIRMVKDALKDFKEKI